MDVQFFEPTQDAPNKASIKKRVIKKLSQLDIDFELELRLSGEYVPGTPSTRTQDCPMGYPGDEPSLKGFGVELVSYDTAGSHVTEKRLDITEFLTGKRTEELYNRLLEYCAGEA